VKNRFSKFAFFKWVNLCRYTEVHTLPVVDPNVVSKEMFGNIRVDAPRVAVVPEVGLYKFHPELEGAWFQVISYQVISLVSNFAFKFNLYRYTEDVVVSVDEIVKEDVNLGPPWKLEVGKYL
jgi:hypothetical protein